MRHFRSFALLFGAGWAIAMTAGCGEEVRGPGASAPAAMESVSQSVPAERQIIRTGSVNVRVDDPIASERKARSLVASAGGFVESAQTGNRDAAIQRISLTARVPVTQFDATMSAFGGLGVRLSSQESSEDVTLQVVDLDARLKTLLAEESSLREMMRSARSVDASLRIHERLSEIRGQIESMAGQRKALARQAAMSTITLQIEGDPNAAAAGNPQWTKDAWAGARGTSTQLVQLAGTLGIYLAVLWPLWVVPLALIVLGVWQSRRRRAVPAE